MNGEYLCVTPASIANKSPGEIYSWEDLYSEQFPVSEELYKNWVSQNAKVISWESLSVETGITFFSENELENLSANEQNRWSVFYTISQPGISTDKKNALIQVTAYCPAGPPNYGSIFLLEKNNTGWCVAFSYGLYNQ